MVISENPNQKWPLIMLSIFERLIEISKATDELSIFLYGIDSLDDLANVLKLS